MREILFRGKRIDNGEWIEGCFVNIWMVNYKKHQPFITDNEGVSYEIDLETVGQYTGLTDKNGKRIFEGDICQIKNHHLIDETPFVVEWEDFVYNGWTWKDLDENGSVDSFTDGAAKNCEIIGNMRDNPELLKGGD